MSPPTTYAGQDTWLWRWGPDKYKNKFSAKRIWELIRQPSPRLIWFPYQVLRYAFIAWLSIQDRLSIGARTRGWGDIQRCILCGEPNDTRDHLFFACPYSFSVWTSLCGSLIGRTITPN
ncbi:hypothetical protein V5N11_025775 [Cardamine amara subsp. amara]|uniref:Reverse transcriptase zinc-binding domain-containing protein n=1 Tax=Cardamine amara subsp. amara TaxID=228776 RepID=A0ABD1C869_CARAN